MHDVAARAGVGLGTVSRVVNGGAGVSESTRERVHAAIAEVGYNRNEAARMLRPGQTSAAIGLIVDDLNNPFSSSLANGAAEFVKAHEHVLLIGSTQRDPAVERELVREFVRRQVDGLLIVTSGLSNGPGEDIALATRTPVVYVDRAPTTTVFDRVELDNYAGVRLALTRLIDDGHRRIAYIGGSPEAATGLARLRAYRRILRAHELDVEDSLISMDNYSAESARQSALRLLRSDTPPTAIFSDNNRMTLGVIEAFTVLGSTVGLAGFDDIEFADILPFDVHLVVYAPGDLGKEAARQLFRRIGGDDAKRAAIRVTTRLDRRGRRFHDEAAGGR
jgi:LacI family transcriptional regulator